MLKQHQAKQKLFDTSLKHIVLTVTKTATAFCLTMAKLIVVCNVFVCTVSTATILKTQYYRHSRRFTKKL